MFRLSELGYLPKKFLVLKPFRKQILCPSCLFGSAKRRSWRTRSKYNGIRKEKQNFPGAKVSIDQMVSAHPGLVPRLSGRHTNERITCVTVYKDHYTDYSYSHLQTDVSGDSTEASKEAFERHANDYGNKIMSYHADNGRFAELQFREAIKNANQSISFCAVGAHHQNGIIERHIGMLTEKTRTLLLHAKRMWPEMIGPLLWPFAWKAAEFRYNLLHLDAKGRSPLQKFSKSDIKSDIKILHTFGCPVFVLDSRIQSGFQAMPKWEPRSRVGIYLGHSPCHAGNITLVLNPKTMHVSPQYHLVFDDTFSTVPFMRTGEFPTNWKELVNKSQEYAMDKDFREAASYYKIDAIDNDINKENSKIIHIPRDKNITTNESKENDIFNDDNSKKEEYEDSLLMPTMPDLNKITLRRSKRIAEKNNFYNNFYSTSTSLRCKIFEFPTTSVQKAIMFMENVNAQVDKTINKIHHMVYVADSDSNETYTYSSMMKQPDRIKFIDAMLLETQEHETRGHWSVWKRSEMPPNIKTIMSIWSFKRKRAPDGRILKYKARLCCHGGMQQWGVNFWETYAPVINWLSVRTLLALSLIHGLHTRSIDFVLAFPQAKLESDVFMEIPMGMNYGEENDRKNYVLKLEKNLYGLKDAAYNWWEHLKGALQKRGFKNLDSDPCVFIKNGCIILTYVDDCIIFTKTKAAADNVIESLRNGDENFDFTDDGDLTTYLGMDVIKNDKTIELKQPHLISRILKAMGIDETFNEKSTTACKPLLNKDLNGDNRTTNWNYRQVIGMLNYLQGSTRPDLAMSVHQCARFCQQPMLSHERAVQRIGRYLLGNKDKGIKFTPDLSKGVECFVDADFAGGFSKEMASDSSSLYSRTGFVIFYAGCPVLWASKMQTEIALSTAESEYIALSTALRDVIPFLNLLQEIKEVFNINNKTTKFYCQAFEDNESCITIAKAKKFTPRTKHIALKYHHFREYVKNGKIEINSIDTLEQTADILTKPLTEQIFTYLRRKLIGW